MAFSNSSLLVGKYSPAEYGQSEVAVTRKCTRRWLRPSNANILDHFDDSVEGIYRLQSSENIVQSFIRRP